MLKNIQIFNIVAPVAIQNSITRCLCAYYLWLGVVVLMIQSLNWQHLLMRSNICIALWNTTNTEECFGFLLNGHWHFLWRLWICMYLNERWLLQNWNRTAQSMILYLLYISCSESLPGIWLFLEMLYIIFFSKGLNIVWT